jgi:hypothetical protein
MATTRKRPVAEHADMPADLKTSLDGYSTAMQVYRNLLNGVASKDRLSPLPRLRNGQDVAALKQRTELLRSRCMRLKMILSAAAPGIQSQEHKVLPPHLRALLGPPVGCQSDCIDLAERKADESQYRSERKDEIAEVCDSTTTPFTVHWLTTQ